MGSRARWPYYGPVFTPGTVTADSPGYQCHPSLSALSGCLESFHCSVSLTRNATDTSWSIDSICGTCLTEARWFRYHIFVTRNADANWPINPTHFLKEATPSTFLLTPLWKLNSLTLDIYLCSPFLYGVSCANSSSLYGSRISPAVGHLRPLCAFSAKVLQERHDVAITFLIVGDRRKQVEREIRRYLSDSKVDLGATGNIR